MAIHQANRDYRGTILFMVPCLLIAILLAGYMLAETFDSLWFKPWLITIAVFYWTLYVPTAVPIWFALLLGLLEDGLTGTPFGLYGMGIIVLHHMVMHQRKSLIYSPFPVVVTGFWINLLVVMLILTGIMWFIGLPLTWWILWNWVLTAMLFLPIAILFEIIRQKFMKD